jgi:hypothetical protein
MKIETLTFTKTDSRDVAAGVDVPLDFMFQSTTPPPGKGKLSISIQTSKSIINAGESVDITGTVMYPSRLRDMPIRLVNVRIMAGDKQVAKARTDMQGNYSATIVLSEPGAILIYAEVTGPLGAYVVSQSATIQVLVI